jgi:SAM-dependent methyltransferase
MHLPTPQRVISLACEQDLARYGDSFRGAGYTKSAAEAAERYALMLGLLREPYGTPSVLDLGCGLGHLLDFIESRPQYQGVQYAGLDISPKYVTAARARHPGHNFLLMDVLENDRDLPKFDYVILNGLFNYRGSMSVDSMLTYWQQLVAVAFNHCRVGIAFNVMSKLVDWERDDLFHLPFDQMAAYLRTSLSQHFVIRHDYRAYEYTTYVYRQPFKIDLP